MNKIPKFLSCPYCGGKAYLKDSSIIYGRSFGLSFICENYPKCDTYVGTHKETLQPLGTLANKELRELRKKCHYIIDPLWKSKKFKRAKVYLLLSKIMGLPIKITHIAFFDNVKCNQLLMMHENKKIELRFNEIIPPHD